MKYDEDATTTRWLILGDKNQTFPSGELIVKEGKDQPTKSGKTMPVLTLEDIRTGDSYQICAWKRDVLECINEFGVDTKSWGNVRFENKNGRMQLLPCKMVVVEECV